MVLKPFFGLYGILLLARRDKRALFAWAGAILAGYVGGLAVTGVAGYRAWVTNLQQIAWVGHPLNASVWGLAARWFSPQPRWADASAFTPYVSATLQRAIGLGLAGIVIAFMVRAWRRADRDQTFAAVGIAAILLSPLGWIYYFPIVLAPIVAGLARTASSPWVILPALIPTVLLTGHAYGGIGTAVWGAVAPVIGFVLLWCTGQRSAAGAGRLDTAA
jgi:hypothetical protein